jgi:hypothetical protein
MRRLASIKLAACKLATFEEKNSKHFVKPPEGFDSWSSLVVDLCTEISRLHDTLYDIKGIAKTAARETSAYGLIVEIVDDVLDEEVD